ncbi:MAG: response regulator [Gammaproteobacteria bacterium]|nr:response regulator [Gammaproteobacteria bacterium]MDE0224151.1 response regulator [Gammaproteobacteria bacterium]
MSGELIFLVDDDDAVRTAIHALLETAGYRTVQFGSGAEFLECPDLGRGACVLLDVKMPGPDGLEVQRRLNDRSETLPVVILTGHGDIAMAVQAIRAGAVDFLEKPVSRDRLLKSVERAVDIDHNVRQDRCERSAIGTRLRGLTKRERQVLERLVLGRTNKFVARELGISPRTIEVYRRNVMTKMGADSLSHLVRMTLLAGIDPVGNATP